MNANATPTVRVNGQSTRLAPATMLALVGLTGFAACTKYRIAVGDGSAESINSETPDASGSGGRPGMDGASSDGDSRMDLGESKGGGVVLTIDSTVHDFGMVVTATPSADATFVVMNSGTVDSPNLSAALSDPSKALGFSIKTDHCSGMSLTAGQTCQIVVVLTPISAGSPAGDLTVTAGSGSSVTAHLTATAIAPGALRISPDTQSFGMVAQNQRQPRRPSRSPTAGSRPPAP